MISALEPVALRPSCPLCGASDTRERRLLTGVLSLPKDIAPRVRQCGSCGFLFLSPYLNDRELEALYSGTYFSGSEQGTVKGSGMDYEHCAQVRLDKFGSTLDSLLAMNPKAKSVLDVGAATGEFLDLARQKGLEVAGIELSEWACARALEKFGLEFSNQPFESFSPGRKYDLIHLNHVLEHFPNPNAAASKIAELLTLGGLAYIEVPYQFNAAESVAARLGMWKRPFSTFSLHHPIFFTPKTLRKLFAAHRMETVALKCYCWDRYGDAPTSPVKKVARAFLKTIGQGQVIEGVFRHE